MQFGSVAVKASEGAILAHSVKLPDFTLKKGEKLSREQCERLSLAGVAAVVVARLEPGDVEEDLAAARLADRLAGSHVVAERPFTGRCNLFTESKGVLLVDAVAFDRINEVDEAVTVATLPSFQPVEVGQLVGSVKIVPFSVPQQKLRAVLDRAGTANLSIAPFIGAKVGLISTVLPGLKTSTIKKTRTVTRERLKVGEAAVATDVLSAHTASAISAAIKRMAEDVDLLLIFGASAITDRRDVVPAGIVEAGGAILQLGMPVDPGNLLALANLPRAELQDLPIIAAPGCARSPKPNGFDFVLFRYLAGLSVSPLEIRRMGVGGLLHEIPSRPQPREPETRAQRVAEQVRRSRSPVARSTDQKHPGTDPRTPG